jgi:hypothetical protein
MLHKIVLAHAQKNPDYLWQEDTGIYVQPSHNTPQKNFKEIDDYNYEEMFEDAWRMEGRWVDVLSDIVLHLYVYLQPKPKPNKLKANNKAKASNRGLQRATKSRTIFAMRKIRHEEEAGLLPKIGSIRRAHLARHMARRPEILEEGHRVEIPVTNIF